MNTQTLLFQNSYKTLLTEPITSLWDIDFTLAEAPRYNKWFIVISPNSTIDKEILFFDSKDWARVFVKWVNRDDPKEHIAWEIVQINDVAEIFNFLSQNLATTFYLEKTWNLSVKVWGWNVLVDNEDFVVWDTNIDLADWVTTYICYDHLNNDVFSSLTQENIVMAVVTTAWWEITNIGYRNYKINATNIKSPYDLAVEQWYQWSEVQWLASLQWEPWATWPAGSITEAPVNTQQTIIDNQVIAWITVVSDWISYIKVTLPNWNYTNYLLNKIITADVNDNVLSTTSLVWSFTIPNNSWITYSNWLYVNKTTGYTNFTWSPMYKDKSNNVTWVNTFNDTTIFNWQISFTYFENPLNDTTFNANDGTKQRMSINAWWPQLLNFTNLLAWNTLMLAINVLVNPITLTKWTATWDDIDWNPISFTFYNISWDTYPLALWVWTHLFWIECFSQAVHLSYLWESIAI
jgi:hypothetical protein